MYVLCLPIINQLCCRYDHRVMCSTLMFSTFQQIKIRELLRWYQPSYNYISNNIIIYLGE